MFELLLSLVTQRKKIENKRITNKLFKLKDEHTFQNRKKERIYYKSNMFDFEDVRLQLKRKVEINVLAKL